METRRHPFVYILVLSMLSSAAVADDAAGVMGIQCGTNAVFSVEMPFAPFGAGLPADFVSGNFAGDGGEDSDILCRISASSGEATNAVYSCGEWLDPATLSNTTMTVSLGDAIRL